VARAFAQEEQQLRRPRDDPFRRDAIARAAQRWRSHWRPSDSADYECLLLLDATLCPAPRVGSATTAAAMRRAIRESVTSFHQLGT
jgi:hypothetical protein